MNISHALIVLVLLNVVTCIPLGPKFATPKIPKALPGTCPIYPIPVPFSYNNPMLTSALAAVDKYLQQQIQQVDMPGLMIAVVYDQDIVWHNEYVPHAFTPS